VSATLVNRTGHLAQHAVMRDGQGGWMATVAVKSSYTWDGSGTLTPVPADPLLDTDQYAGDPASTGLLRASELGPPKPRVDVLLAGALAFPAPVEAVDVGIFVGTRLSKTARVFGDRRWQFAVTRGLAPSRAHPTHRVPICWERAFGGTAPEDPRQWAPENPAGCGLATTERSLTGQLVPNFEDPLHPIGSWKDRPKPRGFGPIAPHWSPRRLLAGTYDDRWTKTRRPLAPPDFDPRFFNVAPPDQQLDGYLAGEEVRIVHMTSTGRDRFILPECHIPVAIVTDTELFEDAAAVDTITIEPESRRLTLVARAAAPLSPDPTVLRRIVVGELTRGWRIAFERGKEYLALAGLRA
jgi:hypothetical protein